MAKKRKAPRRPRRTVAPAIDQNTFEVPVNRLRWHCTPDDLGVTSLDQVQPSTEIIGQDRALKALDFGLGITDRGYNIYVSGVPGT